VKLFLDENPRVTKLRIEGHTDNVGTAESNVELSGQRRSP
jgi:outer membrane protein OmpA-like peptidoglycan-associated protein